MSRRPWHKRYHGDFLSTTSELTLEERGALNIVLDYIYLKGGPIRNNSKWLGDVGRCSTRKWEKICRKLIELDFLYVNEEGRLSSHRAERELKAAGFEHKMRKINGAKGGKKSAENRARLMKNNGLSEDRLKHARASQNPDSESRDGNESDEATPAGALMANPEEVRHLAARARKNTNLNYHLVAEGKGPSLAAREEGRRNNQQFLKDHGGAD